MQKVRSCKQTAMKRSMEQRSYRHALDSKRITSHILATETQTSRWPYNTETSTCPWAGDSGVVFSASQKKKLRKNVSCQRGYGPQAHVMILLGIFPKSLHLIENGEDVRTNEGGRWIVEDEGYLYFFPAEDISTSFPFPIATYFLLADLGHDNWW